MLHFSELKNQHSLPTWVFNQFNQSALLLDQQVFGRQEHKMSPINAGHSLSYLSARGFHLHVEFLQPLQSNNLIITSTILFSLQVQIIFVVLLKQCTIFGSSYKWYKTLGRVVSCWLKNSFSQWNFSVVTIFAIFKYSELFF